jgi:S-adenosylmethionine/arginine decarboxylase-like enzyme
VTSRAFSHRMVELTGVPGVKLGDQAGLSAVAIAAAAAIGLSAFGPPVVGAGPKGLAVGLLCHGGHILLHALPEEGRCLVDIVALAPASAERAVEVISKRLGTDG